MIGFEPGSSGVGSDRAVDCATATAPMNEVDKSFRSKNCLLPSKLSLHGDEKTKTKLFLQIEKNVSRKMTKVPFDVVKKVFVHQKNIKTVL